MAKYADTFVYVVRAHYLDKRLLHVPQTLYKENKLTNMSVVLNGTQSEKGYGYGYGYGYAPAMMMVPVAMVPMAMPAKKDCHEHVTTEYVTTYETVYRKVREVRYKSVPTYKRVRIAPDKRVQMVPDKRVIAQ